MRRQATVLALQLALASAGLSDIYNHLTGGGGGGGSAPPRPRAAAAPDCAATPAHASCQPRSVLAVQNCGPDEDTPREDRMHAGAGTTLRWSDAASEAGIAAVLAAALGPELIASLAAEGWGPQTQPHPRWRVYSADGERVTDWAAVLAAPTLASFGHNASDTPLVGEGAVAVPGVPPLYLVPEGRLFIWPTHAVGQTVPVPGTPPDPPQTRLRPQAPVLNLVLGVGLGRAAVHEPCG